MALAILTLAAAAAPLNYDETVDGDITNGSALTVGGGPQLAVPLPAAAWLSLAALGFGAAGLSGARRAAGRWQP